MIRAARAGGVTRFADSRLKNIIAADIPRWREAVRARLKEVNIPPDLDAEVQTYQQAQLFSLIGMSKNLQAWN